MAWQTGLKVPTLRIHGLHTNATYVPLRIDEAVACSRCDVLGGGFDESVLTSCAKQVLVSRPGTSGGWQECILNRFLDANPDYPFRFVQFTNLLILCSSNCGALF